MEITDQTGKGNVSGTLNNIVEIVANTGNPIEPLAFILQKHIFGLWAFLMIYLKGLSSRLVVNFVLANIMSGFNVGLVCSNVLDVAIF